MFAETACACQHIIGNIVAGIKTIVLVNLLIDNGGDSGDQLVLFHIRIQLRQLIVNRRRQGEMNTSLVIQDTGFHAQQVVTLALHKVRIIAFLLKLLCFEEIARIELVRDCNRKNIQFHQV